MLWYSLSCNIDLIIGKEHRFKFYYLYVMSIDRKSFKLPIRKKKGLTKWNCPTCGKGLLKIVEGTFHHDETRDSKRSRSSDDWEPEWIEYIYSCLLECNNTACKDIASSSGVGTVDYFIDYDEGGNLYEDLRACFTPKHFSPHLKIFDYQKNIPNEVKNELDISFSVFFCDPSSAANHIRIALENLLTHMDIIRFATPKGKRRYLTLHERIELLPKKHLEIKDLFVAIKWLGNAGSHSHRGVSSDDVFDAYELMEELLVEVFSNKRKNIKKLANKINKKKGPTKSDVLSIN